MSKVSLNVATFIDIANKATFFGSRDIVVQGQGKNSSARLGNLVFSHGAAANKATMEAFKAALEKEYGVFGTHAFDTGLGARRGDVSDLSGPLSERGSIQQRLKRRIRVSGAALLPCGGLGQMPGEHGRPQFLRR